MIKIISTINDDFSNGLYCDKYTVIVHKWSGYVNANDICGRYGINYNEWIAQPICIATSNYIKEELKCKPTHLMPHGIEQTQGIYIHPLLLPYLILQAGSSNFLMPGFGNEQAKTSQVAIKFITALKNLCEELIDEPGPNPSPRPSPTQLLRKPVGLDLYKKMNYGLSPTQKFTESDSDAEPGDAELLRQKIKRQIKKLNKNY